MPNEEKTEYLCRCGQPAAVDRRGELLCWWCYLGEADYKLKFSDAKYQKMKKYQKTLATENTD